MSDCIIEYNGDRHDVLEWLIKNMNHTQLSPSGMSGLDEKGHFIWRIAVLADRVLFTHEKDAVLFTLRWS